MSKMRLAIVGAGPAGIYAADLLLKAERDFEVEIDLFEQLPAPYGLVRYGVSPDHPRIKGIITALRDVLDSGQIRYFGNVRYGRDITLEDLKRHYNAVIFSTGAIRDANLNIPGIDAEASYGAADYVSWFDGHPDVPRTWPLEAESVGVIGNGNVALDVSRMLIKHADDLLPTEIPQNVYEGLKNNPIQELHLFGRRGPKYVKFTPLELRELGEVRDVDMIVDERDFDREDAYADEVLAKNKQITVITRIMDKWRAEQVEREASGERASRRLHMHFWSKPVEVVVEGGRVAGLKIERTAPDGEGGVIDTGEFEVIPDAGALPRRWLPRVAARRDPVRRRQGRHPERAGARARSRRCPDSWHLRDRLDQAGSRGPDWSHEVRRDGDAGVPHGGSGKLVAAWGRRE